jgi:hypothetical protein
MHFRLCWLLLLQLIFLLSGTITAHAAENSKPGACKDVCITEGHCDNVATKSTQIAATKTTSPKRVRAIFSKSGVKFEGVDNTVTRVKNKKRTKKAVQTEKLFGEIQSATDRYLAEKQ